MNEQIWIDIVGYEGEYQISNDGQVKSLKGGKEKLRSLVLNNEGYLSVILSSNGKTKCYRIHKLVASHFVPGYQPGMVVNHIDEDKTNNVASNLEWVTVKQNTNYGSSIEKGVATRQSNRGKSIYCPELDMTFSTQEEAARYFGCGRQYISKVLTGMYNTVKGYHLIYI
jgi:hypothetical protein